MKNKHTNKDRAMIRNRKLILELVTFSNQQTSKSVEYAYPVCGTCNFHIYNNQKGCKFGLEIGIINVARILQSFIYNNIINSIILLYYTSIREPHPFSIVSIIFSNSTVLMVLLEFDLLYFSIHSISESSQSQSGSSSSKVNAAMRAN